MSLHGYSLELDCRWSPVPAVGQVFTASVADGQFEVVRVEEYPEPQARPLGTWVTHFVRFKPFDGRVRVQDCADRAGPGM